MKNVALCRQERKPLPFPNAATRREIFGKLLDTLLITVCAIGIAAALLLILCLG